MAYQTNRFCWHGLVTTDPAKSAAFYPEVLGWKVQNVQMGDSTASMFAASDVPLAHYMEPPMPGVPSHWNNYLRVDSVDETAAAAVANGGTQLVEPTDIPPGRFAVVQSPSGAMISLFHEADDTASHHPGGTGSVHWVELQSKDIDKDIPWLPSTFGFELGEMAMPNGATYHLLKHDGEMRGGAMAQPMPEAPSMFLTWFQVEHCDDTLARVANHGGKALSPAMDMPNVGRMAVVADSTGAVFGVIQPAQG